MPVDPMELLAWLADREDDYPGAWLDGSSLMQQTAGMAGADGLPWEAVTRAAATLRKRGYLDWDYDKWPNELQEPPPQQLDYMTFQRTKNIAVSGAGYQALEARKAKSAATQINIIHSIGKARVPHDCSPARNRRRRRSLSETGHLPMKVRRIAH